MSQHRAGSRFNGLACCGSPVAGHYHARPDGLGQPTCLVSVFPGRDEIRRVLGGRELSFPRATLNWGEALLSRCLCLSPRVRAGFMVIRGNRREPRLPETACPAEEIEADVDSTLRLLARRALLPISLVTVAPPSSWEHKGPTYQGKYRAAQSADLNRYSHSQPTGYTPDRAKSPESP